MGKLQPVTEDLPADTTAAPGGICAPGAARDSQRGGIISKFIFLVFVVFVVGVLYLFRVPLLRMAGRMWIVEETPQPSDAIVPLGGDNAEADRAQRAAELYKQGWAPTVVASGRILRNYTSDADLTERDLRERGVPTEHIMRLTHYANDTLQELIVIERTAAANHWKKLLIVTSNYHTRRTRMLARALFPAEFEVRVISAPDVDYDPDHWWQHRKSQKIFLHELVGYIVGEWEVRRELKKASDEAPSATMRPHPKGSPEWGPDSLSRPQHLELSAHLAGT
jgi:uncharacterized SAM-binding protein YcdF (DUF218 family)